LSLCCCIERRIDVFEQRTVVHTGNGSGVIHYYDLGLRVHDAAHIGNNGWYKRAEDDQDQNHDGTDLETSLGEAFFVFVLSDQTDVAWRLLLSCLAHTDCYRA
jgi:hypothetical protein